VSLKESEMKRLLMMVGLLTATAAVAGLIQLGYKQSWTGFQAFTNPSEQYHRAKTLWDWLELLGVPMVLALAVFVLNRAQRESELRAATSQQREATLQSYLTAMSELLLKHDLRHSPEDAEVRSLARARTLTAARELDGRRKGFLVRFLVESSLAHGARATESNPPRAPAIRLDGADLTGADLTGVNFQDVDLSGVDLRGADLRHARLHGARTDARTRFDPKWLLVWLLTNNQRSLSYTRGADLREANLSGATLTSIDLRAADLRGADLEGVDLFRSRISFTTRLDRKWKVVWTLLNVRRPSPADFPGADLSGAALVASDLPKAQLQGADCSNADFSYSELREADLSQANLSGARFHESSLRNADLRACSAWGADFDSANLEGADLRRAYFLFARAAGANLRNANCTVADWESATLTRAQLDGSKLDSSNLKNCDLVGASLCGANLDDAQLEGAKLQGCRYDEETIWPAGFDFEAAGAVHAAAMPRTSAEVEPAKES
jgi:uncharacterized protein YjbI with pentapeptide repeats